VTARRPRGWRRHEDLVVYSLAALTYVAGGVAAKTYLLNWIVGPLYLVAAVLVLPPLIDRVLRVRR
jgi:hypothetical protein